MRGRGKKETPAALAALYEEHARGQRELVEKLQRMDKTMAALVGDLRCLLNDEHFVTLLRAERLDRVPAALLRRAQA